jgi:hypothetical protein
MNPDDRLAIALWEADRHAAALSDALAEWAAGPALDMAQLERDRLLLRLADQILFRFTKLQDALAERLVPATLQQCSSWPNPSKTGPCATGWSAWRSWAIWRLTTGCAGANCETASRTSIPISPSCASPC